jgi:hypothetical protein
MSQLSHDIDKEKHFEQIIQIIQYKMAGISESTMSQNARAK